jgi:hypothetical protein
MIMTHPPSQVIRAPAMPPALDTPAPVSVRVRLSRAEKLAIRAFARSSGSTVSGLLRVVADGASVAYPVGARIIGARERDGAKELLGRLRAAGMGFNDEVRALHAQLAGFGARPDLERMGGCVVELLAGTRRAAALLARVPRRDPVRRTEIASAHLTKAQHARAASAAAASGLKLTTFLRQAVLRKIGSPVARPLDGVERGLVRDFQVQLRGAAGNAQRLGTGRPRGFIVSRAPSEGRDLLRGLEDFLREARALLEALGEAPVSWPVVGDADE